MIDDRTDPIDEVFESRFDARGKWSNPPADLERLMLSKEISELIRGCMNGLPVNQRALKTRGSCGRLECRGHYLHFGSKLWVPTPERLL